ncbi:MAG TPA: carboxypeptidase-like regulatory domain-containing protein, partial [Terriglobales bacterium]|nr:carboxypeptidase-like regulatory domain-containing protein [Terriglobales bacterium]
MRTRSLPTRLSQFVLLIVSIQLFGQTPTVTVSTPNRGNNGVVAGRAIDAAGAVLRGAIVELQPGVATTVTDAAGDFVVANLSPGDYTLTISYVGFSAFSTTVKVLAAQTVRVDAKLNVAT